MGNTITIRRPDDWHVHLRDGPMLAAVLPATAGAFGRALVMPNLDPPITTVVAARAYRDRMLAVLDAATAFTPLLTCYLTDATDPDDLRRGHAERIFVAAKLYPAGATFRSDHGVSDIRCIHRVLEVMQAIGMPLCVHGEVIDPAVDIFDRESVFIDRVLHPLRRQFPALRIVFEHITTQEAVDYVRDQTDCVAATITPHHLLINRNAMFRGGIRPHYYCLPVAKREVHRQRLCEAATSGDPRFFLGTDSAPHAVTAKESACGCAGIFNAPAALACYAQVFEDRNAMHQLEGFAALHGAAFYGLAPSTELVRFEKLAQAPPLPAQVEFPGGTIAVFAPDQALFWQCRRASPFARDIVI